MSEPDGNRLLLVHAHPDDESIWTGATMAKYAAQGAHVCLVTCTLGELGIVAPRELAHLDWEADGGLGEYRMGELDSACEVLGVTDHRFLGGPGRWRDSGSGPASHAECCFWQADITEAAGELLRIIRQLRPQAMVTYDDQGIYGHPDHIQAHRVAWRAFELADGLVSKFYATAVPKSVLWQAIERKRSESPLTAGWTEFSGVNSVHDLQFGTADEKVTTQIDAVQYLEAKLAAMRAHVTQNTMHSPFFIAVHDPAFALSEAGQRLFGVEYYTLLAGPRGTGAGKQEHETDLFAGLAAPGG
jgi:N-acetyl-1-D-myo-inositol-2-amino-2-deoxy-alpha-D-glucopyranoside deacetylase